MDDLIEQVITSAVMNQYIYSKVQFDNAKDTTELIAAANESNRALIAAASYKLRHHAEALVAEKLKDAMGDKHECLVHVDGRVYKVMSHWDKSLDKTTN